MFCHEESMAGQTQPRFHSLWLAVMVVAAATVTGVSTAAYLSTRAKPAPLKPGLHPDSLVRDFGPVGQGEQLRTTFELLNAYPARVSIRSVSAGCSCQSAEADRAALGPGERCKVSATWKTGSGRGRVTELLWVLHTIPGSASLGRLELRVTADIEPDIAVEPFGCEFPYGQPGTRVVSLRPGRMRQFTVREVYTNSKAFAADHDKSNNTVTVSYRPTGDLDIGPSYRLTVVTDSANEPSLNIPLKVTR